MADAGTPPTVAANERASVASEMTTLVAAHHAVVYRYACRLCGCPVEAEDLTQQTFLIAQQKVRQLREPERVRGWLLAVVRSCFLKSVRRPRPISAQVLDLDIDQVPDQTPAVEQVDREALHAALNQLPDEFRVVLLMFYFEVLSYQQIAEQLELPIGTVMSRLSRAKTHLRKKLTGEAAQPHSTTVRRRTPAIAGTTKPIPVRSAP